MKVGDLVQVKREDGRYYILLQKVRREEIPFGEHQYILLSLKDGVTRSVSYSQIKVVSSASTESGRSDK